ncbi:hypothetical protein EJ03DRAFT_351466 [Teratosphaeria nubilosa]|uniref:Uncharacterized protein n=1 Tax=Teratosphaeria nubilosa TaxID=161662 RepID=A0A6G1L8R0_9PEZI|nr:hypothetical protein EJ03DRAFT_351466 [Teratosphaeria nubilosa]
MPLRKKLFNDNMQRITKEGPAGSSSETVDAEMDLKKHVSNTPDLEYEAEHEDWSDKKDHPPRFSTLFGVAPPLPERRAERHEPRRRRSGVFLPTPVFVLFVIILIFESTLLFAYTVIGLYNNLPQRLVPAAGRTETCNCGTQDKQPAVNIAPNFMMPQVPAIITQTVTALGNDGVAPHSLSTTTASSTSTSSTSTTSSSTSSDSSGSQSSEAAAIASEVAGMLHTLITTTSTSSSSVTTPSTSSPPSIVTVTVTPAQSTVSSTTILTVTPTEASTSIIRPTVTSILYLDPSQAAASSSADAAALSSISADEASILSSIYNLNTATMTFSASTSTRQSLPVVVTPAATSAEAGSTTSSALASSTAVQKGKVCFGGAGAVEQNCI